MKIVELDSPARQLLASALAAAPVRLDLAAIAIGMMGDPAVDADAVIARLDALGARVRSQASAEVTRGESPLPGLRALQVVLAEEDGLLGRREGYDEPERSFIHRVLETRVGLPITLSVIYVEVARRAGIPLFGIGFPGHFLAGTDLGDRVAVIDPFHGGRLLTQRACEELLAQFAPGMQWSPGLLAPAPTPTIAFRMLTNLKHAYQTRGERERLLETLHLLLAILPDHPGELRARAELLAEMGAHRAALADYRRCHALAADAEGKARLAGVVQALEAKVGAAS